MFYKLLIIRRIGPSSLDRKFDHFVITGWFLGQEVAAGTLAIIKTTAAIKILISIFVKVINGLIKDNSDLNQ